MKALSLLQPWATLIMLGYKQYETRSWATKHRGRLAIHASAGKPASARQVCEQDEIIRNLLAFRQLTFDTLPRGVVLGSCEVRCMHPITPAFRAGLAPRELAAGDYSCPGRWAWELGAIDALPSPVPCRGALSIWEVPAEVEGIMFELTAEWLLPGTAAHARAIREITKSK